MNESYRSSHAPEGYDCPFCRIARGEDGDALWTVQSDVFYRTGFVTAFVNARWWVNNPGHAIVIPNQHVENIYRCHVLHALYLILAKK